MSPTATLTYTYREFDIFNPKSWVFDIVDISKALGNQCRFNGHVSFYSVAEHCYHVSEVLELQGHDRNIQLMGLLHDAAEAYIGDIPGPWKPYVKLNDRTIEEVEKDIEMKMFDRFEVDYSEDAWALVKAADKLMYKEEATARPAPGYGWDPDHASGMFLRRFHLLR